MNKKEKLAFAVVAALAMSGGGFAVAQSVNNVSSDQVIYACVTGVNGNIVRVSNTRKTCPRGTTPIQWNAAGPRGEQGIPGSAVAKGDKGDTGPQGIQGAPGESGQATSFEVLLIGPENQKSFYFDLAGAFLHEDLLWYWTGNAFKPYEFEPWATPAYFESSDCSGSPYFSTADAGYWWLFPEIRPMTYEGTEFTRNKTFLVDPSNEMKSDLMRSALIENTCTEQISNAVSLIGIKEFVQVPDVSKANGWRISVILPKESN
jgi:hypothetical protein